MFDPLIAERVEQEGLALPCWAEDPDLFFAESPADVETAKAICQSCPIRAACLTGALERREPWGVWGGELVLQGVVVPRKRPRGRPRKEVAQAAQQVVAQVAVGSQTAVEEVVAA